MPHSRGLSPLKQALRTRLLSGAARALPPRAEIPPRPNRDSAPLSFAQNQMWVLDQIKPGNPAYNLSIAFRLLGQLDVGALEAGFNAVIQRHEVLRTSFEAHAGEPRQRIHSGLKLGIQMQDLQHLDPQNREAQLQTAASERSRERFDLARLPLIRVTLFKLGGREHVLLFNAHHIVADGVSIHLLLRELGEFYQAFTRDEQPRVPSLPVQYADFSHWERRSVAHESAYADQIAFWQKRLAGRLPILELATDKNRPSVQSFEGSSVFLSIPRDLVEDLTTLGAQAGCTLFMTFLAAFQVLLHRYSGAEDIVIGTPLGTRTHGELEELIGDFLNMAALRCDLSGNPIFTELLRRSRNTTLDAFSNSGMPFGALMNHLQFERDASRNPIFQTMLEVSSMTTRRMGDLAVERFNFDPRIAQFDLSLHLWEQGDGYQGRFEYGTELFERETIERLAANFQRLLRSLVGGSGQRIGHLALLEEKERERIIGNGNATATPLPEEQLLPDVVQKQVERTPDRIAVRIGEQIVSYAELNHRANRIAQALRARRIGRNARVGLCLERSVDMVAALLGILKAGAAYVPLDPSFPSERLRFIANDAQIALLVCSTGSQTGFDLPRERCFLMDEDANLAGEEQHTERSAKEAALRPDAPAYVIYTSGSTGQPKGVSVPHRAVVNFLTSMAREPGLQERDVLLAVTTLSFDIAVLELFLPLTVGASIVLATHDEAMDGRALVRLLETHRATVMQATPLTWRLLLEAGWKPRPLFKALVGGEALPHDLAEGLLSRGVRLWNMYGPTETTVWSTCARITDTARRITIGKPIANTVVRILDSRRNLCPIGVPGELCIGGAGLSLGYWRRPELTAARFIPDPCSSDPTAMLYCSGDRARWRPDGTIEHLGRLDFQVKLRGFRIEPGEIEANIARDPAVRDVVVVVREELPERKQLVAYVVAPNAPAGLADQLRKLLRSALPEYMVPAQFVVLPALPRTFNGKLDRAALPAPPAAEQSPATSDLPRTPTEQMVLQVFREVLGRTNFGVLDSFFDLDGNSLMAARIMFQLSARTGRDLPLRLLFERQTVSGLAEALDTLGFLENNEQSCEPGDNVEIEL